MTILIHIKRHNTYNNNVSFNLQIQERFTTLMTLLEQMIEVKQN